MLELIVPSVTNWNDPGISDVSLKYSPRVSSQGVDASPRTVNSYDPFSNAFVWSLTSTLSPTLQAVIPSRAKAPLVDEVNTLVAYVAPKSATVAPSAESITLSPWEEASTYDLVAASWPAVGFNRLVILESLTSISFPAASILTPLLDSISSIPEVTLIVLAPTSPPILISSTTSLSSIDKALNNESVPPGCKKYEVASISINFSF